MSIRAPFEPDRGANQVFGITPVSGSTTIDSRAKSVRIVNSGANLCYVRVGAGAQVASTSDLAVLGNSSVVISKGAGEETIAAVSPSGTTLHVQTGEGGI